jgi:predicted secreted hydrolase
MMRQRAILADNLQTDRRPARRDYGRLVVWIVLLLAAAGCAPAASGQLASANVVAALSGEADAAFARAYAPMPLTFPQDHGAHPDYQTEWWYFTGNLQDEQGENYGYQFTIFRSALTPTLPERDSDLATNQVYMAHFALTDGPGNRHESFERFSRGAGGLAGATGEPTFSVWLEDWSVVQTGPETMQMVASAETADGTPIALDLTLTETRPMVLHGDAGLSQKGPEAGNASYYYSLIGLDTRGTIRTARGDFAVTGVSWMDHEFGTSALSANAVGWDWFSVQLDNDLALMFAQIRTEDGGALGDFSGTLILPDGTQQVIGQADVVLETLDEWTSPTSGVTYPARWRMTLPATDLVLTLTPIVADQEMRSAIPIGKVRSWPRGHGRARLWPGAAMLN